MKEMNVYDVYIDDGREALKVTVPAESQKAAEKYCYGNGEIIRTRLNPNIQNIDLDCLADTLRRNGWGQLEIDIITRALAQVGLDRYPAFR